MCLFPLTSPSNGNVTCSDFENLSSRCDYECEEGFYLLGSAVSICTDEDQNGYAEWSHPPPICGRKSDKLLNCI